MDFRIFSKKGQLTLWIFLSLKEGPKYVSQLQDSIARFSRETMRAEEQSLYPYAASVEAIIDSVRAWLEQLTAPDGRDMG